MEESLGVIISEDGLEKTSERRTDSGSKSIFRNLSLVAEKMRNVTDEFHSMPREEIEKAIVKDSEGNPVDFNGELGGLETGLVRLDTIVEAIAPNGAGRIRIRFNIETQAVTNPGYLITDRAQYYAAMLLATQNKDHTSPKKYLDLRKVYTVWVCLNRDSGKRSTIDRYGVLPYYSNKSESALSSLMEIVMIYLGDLEKSERPSVTDMLNLIFSYGLDDRKRLTILKDKYNIEVDLELIREVRQMTDWISEAREIGIEQERNRNKQLFANSVVRSMIINGTDKKSAMENVGIPEEYWDDVSALVDSQLENDRKTAS